MVLNRTCWLCRIWWKKDLRFSNHYSLYNKNPSRCSSTYFGDHVHILTRCFVPLKTPGGRVIRDAASVATGWAAAERKISGWLYNKGS